MRWIAEGLLGELLRPSVAAALWFVAIGSSVFLWIEVDENSRLHAEIVGAGQVLTRDLLTSAAALHGANQTELAAAAALTDCTARLRRANAQ